MLFNLLVLLNLFTFDASAVGRVYVKIGTPEFKKPVIAAYSRCIDEKLVCPELQNIGAIFAADMTASNTFLLLPKETTPEDKDKDNISAWKVSGAEYLVQLDFTKKNVTVKLLVLNSGEEAANETLKLGDSYVDAAHAISDLVYKRLTGEPSIFKSKIVMTCKTDGDKYKNLFMMDYDGRRVTQLTSYKTICVSPAWSPDGKYIAYTRYVRKYHRGRGNIVNQELFLYNVKNKKETLLSDVKGQNSGAAWSPDGKSIAFTMSNEKNPNIYLMTVEDKEPKALVQNNGLDVEPSFSPDGKQLAFSSSKTGNPELYVMNIETKEQKRITFSRYYNSSPSWSPMGDMIAFAGLDNPFDAKAYFDIFLITPTGSKIERLTIDSGNNEDPSWSPNGRHLVYSSTRNRGSDIYMINSDGTGEKQITKGLTCYSPDWSR